MKIYYYLVAMSLVIVLHGAQSHSAIQKATKRELSERRIATIKLWNYARLQYGDAKEITTCNGGIHIKHYRGPLPLLDMTLKSLYFLNGNDNKTEETYTWIDSAGSVQTEVVTNYKGTAYSQVHVLVGGKRLVINEYNEKSNSSETAALIKKLNKELDHEYYPLIS